MKTFSAPSGPSLGLLVLVCLAPSIARTAQLNEGIIIVAEGLETEQGTVYCSLYANKEGFPSKPERATARTEATPAGTQATCVFKGIKAGRYAVAVWHDVDSDGKIDSNFIGIPKEPVGASNDARGSFGPPKFDDAAFDFEPPLFRQSVRLD